MTIRFCSQCGASMAQKIPADDDHIRAVCTACGHVHYENPIVVVGTIPVFRDQVLLCKRNIEPRKGKWTLPAGYLEKQESVQDGACRETLEETRAEVRIMAPYRLFNILFVDQIYMMFLADMARPEFGPTPESTDVRLFREADIPWDEIAFEVIRQTLLDYFHDRARDEDAPDAVPSSTPGAADSRIQEAYPFQVKDLVFTPDRQSSG